MKFLAVCLVASIGLAQAFVPRLPQMARGSSLRMSEGSEDGVVLNKFSRYVESPASSRFMIPAVWIGHVRMLVESAGTWSWYLTLTPCSIHNSTEH
jgi:hypothetical protein